MCKAIHICTHLLCQTCTTFPLSGRMDKVRIAVRWPLCIFIDTALSLSSCSICFCCSLLSSSRGSIFIGCRHTLSLGKVLKDSNHIFLVQRHEGDWQGTRDFSCLRQSVIGLHCICRVRKKFESIFFHCGIKRRQHGCVRILDVSNHVFSTSYNVYCVLYLSALASSTTPPSPSPDPRICCHTLLQGLFLWSVWLQQLLEVWSLEELQTDHQLLFW